METFLHADARSSGPPARPTGSGPRTDRLPIGNRFFHAACAVAVGAGLVQAFLLRWTCDDAFITFRYVRNIFRGLGVVYNPGERVEGYTHFLWLMLLSAGRALGIDPVAASQALGLLFFAATLLVLCALTARMHPGRPLVPMAALAVALNYDAAGWATGGLETSLFTFLLTFAFFLMAARPWRPRRRAFVLGIVLGLLVMTRPDGILFLLLGAGHEFLRARGERRPARALLPRELLPLALGSLGLLLPWLAWKLAYYGELLPNPYYAKSAGSAYFSQGFRYIGLFLRVYPVTALILLVPGALAALRTRTHDERPAGGTLAPAHALALALVLVLTYALFFVARVGGDFMFARFLVPLLPLSWFCIEAAVRRLLRNRAAALALVLAGLSLAPLAERPLRHRIYPEGEKGSASGPYGITDERWYWTHRIGSRSTLETYRAVGEELRRMFEGLDVRVLLEGQASLGYYADFPVCIEAAGLTDPVIARRHLERRGRPGHEKSPLLEYLVERRVNFVFMKRLPEDAPYRAIEFRLSTGTIRAEIVTYERALMEELGTRFPDQVRFIDFPLYLEDYLTRLDVLPPEQVRRDYESFRDYYFRNNPDPLLEAPFRRRAGS